MSPPPEQPTVCARRSQANGRVVLVPATLATAQLTRLSHREMLRRLMRSTFIQSVHQFISHYTIICPVCLRSRYGFTVSLPFLSPPMSSPAFAVMLPASDPPRLTSHLLRPHPPTRPCLPRAFTSCVPFPSFRLCLPWSTSCLPSSHAIFWTNDTVVVLCLMLPLDSPLP